VLTLRIGTAISLGLINVGRVLWYRIRKKLGYFRWRLPISVATSGPMFVASEELVADGAVDEAVLRAADAFLSGSMSIFGLVPVAVGTPPDWFANSLSRSRIPDAKLHWSEYGDFSSGLEDIKTIWELSRCSWALVLVRAFRVSGNDRYLQALNSWMQDWLAKNTYNSGPNWMCGQESSIRLGHVLLADSLIRSSDSPTPVLHEFVVRHCERINETTSYAIAQQNNHATSEALGLLLGGAWLKENSSDSTICRSGDAWYMRGRQMLEQQVARLVMDDGTFAQLSMTYQRLFVDTVTMAEWWRGHLELPKFSEEFYARACAATRWLYNFVDRDTGDIPNIGSHDGSALFPLSRVSHRDCRPTVQLAGALFLNKRNFNGEGPWNEALAWLNVQVPEDAEQPRHSQVYPDGGFVMLYGTDESSYLVGRFPSCRFRPAHADALHVDLWRDGVNILRDGGTYGYAVSDDESRYFMGTASHNTCQFDDRDQMPKLGRFLFGAWLKTEQLSFDSSDDKPSWSAAYTDYLGCHHKRTVSYGSGEWLVTDDLSGFQESVVLRWRVCPDVEWSQCENGIRSSLASLSCSSESEFERVEVCAGWESRFYLQKTSLPVLELELGPGHHRVITTISINADVL